MRGRDDGPEPGRGGWPWTRGALVSLWLVALSLLAGTLVLRWDSLIDELSGPPSIAGHEVSR